MSALVPRKLEKEKKKRKGRVPLINKGTGLFICFLRRNGLQEGLENEKGGNHVGGGSGQKKGGRRPGTAYLLGNGQAE